VIERTRRVEQIRDIPRRYAVVVHAGECSSFSMANRIRAIAISRLEEDLPRLR